MFTTLRHNSKQNLLFSASRSSHKPSEGLKTDVAYVRDAWASDLIKVAWPIQDRQLHFQLLVMALYFSLTKSKIFGFIVGEK